MNLVCKTHKDPSRLLTMRQHPTLTVRAHAAASDAGDQHCVTRFVQADVGADFVDDTDAFVLEIGRKLWSAFCFW